MASVTVRISNLTRKILNELADREGRRMQAVLEQAVEEYRRKRFLENLNQAYAAARNSTIWSEFEDELKNWESTLSDGLDETEEWNKKSKSKSTKSAKRKV